MKKVLSIVLALMMVLGAVACAATPTPAATTPTDAPKAEATVTEAPKAAEPAPATEAPAAEPAPEPAAEVSVAPLGLLFKNKTGVTINELYVTPVGEEKGNSIVAAGWQTKDVDSANSEKFIYIVRPAGVEFEITAVYEDGTTATKTTALNMYDEISMKGVAAKDWEIEPANDEDKPAIDLAVALGKTADNTYPGYEIFPLELKNKTGKGIVEYYFYEAGAEYSKYPNMIDNLYNADNEKVDNWAAGKGGLYVFSFFIRPHADFYNVYVVFDDGTSQLYPDPNEDPDPMDLFHADGDGFLPNEISLKLPAIEYKLQYDNGDPEPLQYLIDAVAEGYSCDDWYPTYGETPEVDPELIAAAKAARHAVEEEVAPAEEPAAEPAEENAYTALGLKFKNKYGVAFKEAYIYPVGEDRGANVLAAELPTEGQGEEDSEEVVLFIYRETAKLDKMAVTVVPVEGDEFTWEAPSALGDNYKITVKEPGKDWSYEEITKEKDLAKIAEVVATGVTSDGFYPEAEATETVETAAEPAAEAAVEYAALGLKFKNKYGKAFKEAYIYPVGEDKGANVLTAELPTEGEGPEDSEEVVLFIYRDAAKLDKMAVTVVTVDGEEIYWEAPSALGNNYKITVKADITDWSYDEITKEKDLNKIAEFVALGVTSDGFDPTK